MSSTGFVAVNSTTIPTLNLDLLEFRHQATGARHYHLAADDLNNAFLVAFLTVPQDSTGIAHILEHTSLCGSERFPVRDPFFMMIRRSLNTFMNAFTASDWTAYPFASQNRKDFDNLLEVYLDAAFFPLLSPLDFAQEGHRLEFSEPEDPDSTLTYRGVVYNEMKGAMSSPLSQVGQHLQSHLFPTITYHHNSGGEPTAIPQLTHRALTEFHARHYHPSNAVFMTYGCFPWEEHQRRIDHLALGRFARLDLDLEIPDERRYPQPITVRERHTAERSESNEPRSHVLLGWLLGNSTDVRATMRARVLAGVLLDNSASPLRRVLETTDLGTAPSELCGLDDSTREATFVCGLEGCDDANEEAIEGLVLECLESVAREGVDPEVVEAVLHQVELSQREVSGGGFPYGLQLMVRSLGPALYGADPAAVLEIDPVLEELRRESGQRQFIPRLVRELLLDNAHRVRLTDVPDPDLAEARERDEARRLEEIRASLDAAGKDAIRRRAAELKARQDAPDDPEALPKVDVEDIPRDLKIPRGSEDRAGSRPVTWYHPSTNGLVYVQLVSPLPALDAEELALLPLLCDLLTDVGCDARSYLEVQSWQAAVTGGIRARTSVRSAIESTARLNGYFVLAAKALARNQGAMIELLHATLEAPRFDELARLRELIAQARVHAEAQTTDHGHALAMMAACAGMSACSALEHAWGGLSGLVHLKELDDRLDAPGALEELGQRLGRLHRKLRAPEPRYLAVASEEDASAIASSLAERGRGAARPAETATGLEGFAEAFAPARVAEAWTTATQVSFCARAYPAVPQGHPDAPALRVLGPYLRNGWLHRAIREQGGAYGAGAGYSPDSASFRFFSYRDPRLQGTLDDFDRSISWLLESASGDRLLEEAILGVVGEIDRPDSPSGEAVIAYFGELHGRDSRQRREFRKAVLDVAVPDLRRVAERYLRSAEASTAVLTSTALLESALRQAQGELAGLDRRAV